MKKMICYAGWIIFFQLISYAIGLQYKNDMSGWYALLHKSIVTPPGYVFSIVWPVLYLLLAIAGCLLFMETDRLRNKVLYVVQIILNWSWVSVFFQYHYLLISWIMIIVMKIVTGIVMLDIRKKDKRIFWLLVPYQSWLVFAWYLNFYIWLYN